MTLDPLLNPEPTPSWQAISFKHNAINAFAEAYELNRLGFRLDQMSCIPKPGLSAEVNAQRKMIFNIACRLLDNERDQLMDRAMRLWSDYRKMEPAP